MRRFLSVLLIGSAATMLFRRSRRGQDFMDRMMGNRMGMMRTPRWIRDMGMNMTFARIASQVLGRKLVRRFSR
ncbi:hypothetical protein [Melghirimyces algeriensis]|uniref:Uncharacterized protein n=1 Tax=Melghirimyces algeriensis TaxID=910412 RepID=A0A521CUJ7_9BACL|nr:hypothetical protein [Melghirimyces algeriensis]SMO63102.1 hypothetical protein SAMN06264849_104198 [Melghirimyces algeriensis]